MATEAEEADLLALWQCHAMGQMSEAQWAAHLADTPGLDEWVSARVRAMMDYLEAWGDERIAG